MILVRLRGGLGNQMFQYAAGLRVARQHGGRLVLDLERFRRNFDHEGYVLERAFGVREKGISRSGRVVRDAMRRSRWSDRYRVDQSQAGSLAPALLLDRAPRTCYLDGWWQDEECFLPVANEVRRTFRPVRELQPELAELRDRIKSSTSVAVHVRRGDFVTNRQFNGHLLDPEYYRRAAQAMVDIVGHSRFFVFSDDPSWCRRHLGLLGEVEHVGSEPARPSWIDLELMAACRHHIASNSTFAWWGAWLADCEGQVVIVPGSGPRSGRHFPDRWMRLP